MQVVVIFGLFCSVVVLGLIIGQVIVFQNNTAALTGAIRQFIGGMSLYFTIIAAFVALICFAATVVFILSHIGR